MSTTSTIPQKFNGPSKTLSTFRNCFEACMTFEEALGCAGLADKAPDVIEVLRNYWIYLSAQAEFA